MRKYCTHLAEQNQQTPVCTPIYQHRVTNRCFSLEMVTIFAWMNISRFIEGHTSFAIRISFLKKEVQSINIGKHILSLLRLSN